MGRHSQTAPFVLGGAWLSSKTAYYYLALTICAASVALLWRALDAPLGYTLRATRDSPLRADAIGIDVRRTQWIAFTSDRSGQPQIYIVGADGLNLRRITTMDSYADRPTWAPAPPAISLIAFAHESLGATNSR